MNPEDDMMGLGSAMGGGDADPDPSGPDKDETDSIDKNAANDVLEAIKTGDPVAFRDALKTYVKLCMME